MSSTVALLLAVVFAATTVSAQDRGVRVYPEGSGPEDVRLSHSHDLDHPWTFTPNFKDKAEWQRRAAALREQALVAEGLWPVPQRTPLNPVVHGRIDRDGYTIEKVYFASYPGHYVSGNLYRPKNRAGKLPAVLSPHGHWANGRMYENTDAAARKQIELGAESTMEGAKFPLQARCAMLARMGCVVFFYDMVGYADSTQIEHRAGFTDAEALLRLQSFMGLQTWNSERALDFLLSLPDVDPMRVAVTGASGGGTQTFVLGAIDDRPAVEFPAVMVGEAMQGGCICENAPLLRVGTNNVELAATFAPRPLGMSAANDWTRDMETVAYPKIKTIYELFGVPGNVLGRHFSFEHNYNQVSREMMYNWFNEHLKLGRTAPVKEEPFVPVRPKDLSVYDEQHPRPNDATDAAGLRRAMTEMSDRQIEELWKGDREEYRRVLTTALRVMTGAALPGAAEVSRGHGSERALPNGVRLELGTLMRGGSGEAVPYARLVPANWNGNVVVWADPAGKAGAFDADGMPTGEAAYLVARGNAVIAPDLFMTGENQKADVPLTRPAAAQNAGQKYAGFVYGYNRSALGNRVQDLLTAIAFARADGRAKSVQLVASGKAAVAAVLARALAGDAVDRAAIALGGFDFDRVEDPTDEMMLPGALKYGGVNGFAALYTHGKTLLAGGRRDTAAFARVANSPAIDLHVETGAGPEALVDWLEQH